MLVIPRDTPLQVEPSALADMRATRVDFDVHWKPRGPEFASSVKAFFSGPRPPKDSELPADRVLRAHWIRGRVPAGGFSASVLWHVAVIWILTLPIWGFLPTVTPTLAPVQIELTWTGETVPLPPINLPAAPKPRAAAPKAQEAAPAPDASADTLNPRQTIISIPVRITHPRQTLIQPSAPAEPPKIAPPLPNIVQWPAQDPPKPKLQFAASAAAAPRVHERNVQDVAAPDAPNPEKNAGPINIASQAPVKLAPQMTVPAMSARAAERHNTQTDTAAPDVPSQENSAELQRVIALSAAPAPPSAGVNLPQGNLAAQNRTSGAGGAGAGSNAARGASSDAASGAGAAVGGAGAGANSLPAAIRISPAKEEPANGSGIGSRPLNLNPNLTAAMPKAAPGAAATHADVPRTRMITPGEPPEKILSGKEVYTLHVNLPNLTSSSGSWVLNFAQLDEGALPAFSANGKLDGPVALETVDPKYPQTMVDQHVRGQVVLYAIIRKDGSIDSIQVVQSLEPMLDKNAIRALEQWKFQPGKRAGTPVDLEAVVYIPFEYRNPL